MEEKTELDKMREQIRMLADGQDELTARTIALQSVVEVLAWGTWHDREQLSARLLESGQKSLAAVNTMPERLQRVVVDVWNMAYAQLADPDAAVSIIGVRPPGGSAGS